MNDVILRVLHLKFAGNVVEVCTHVLADKNLYSKCVRKGHRNSVMM